MDLKKFRITASRKKKTLTKFLLKLDDIVPNDLPKLVTKIEAEVWKETDCTECANCCKTMSPTYKRADVVRISSHLGMKPKAFVDKWLEKEAETGDWLNVSRPCQFLVDDKCSIYEVRPKDCAEFPHLYKRPFDLYNQTFIDNLHHCPATLKMVEKLKKKVERDYEWD